MAPRLPVISAAQPELVLKMDVRDAGPHVLLVNYVTPSSVQTKVVVGVVVDDETNAGQAILYACHHTTLCRQAAVDATGKVAVFDVRPPAATVTLRGGGRRDPQSSVAVESVVALPLDRWSLDYIDPSPACVKKDGRCIQSLYPTPPDTKKVEFKTGNEARVAATAPRNIYDNGTALLVLDHSDSIVDLAGKVPGPGAYVFVVHFYQPDFPGNGSTHLGPLVGVVFTRGKRLRQLQRLPGISGKCFKPRLDLIIFRRV